MNTERLDKLVAWKAGLSLANAADAEILEIIRAEVLLDISKRYPWSFLERKSESLTLSSGDTTKDLPPDFARIIHVALKDSSNVIYPVHSEKASTYDASNPDEDDTDIPYQYWLEYDSTTGRAKLVLRPASDGSYTIRLRYLKKLLADQVSLIPDGLIPFHGMMSVLKDGAEMISYKNLYEVGIEKMWASDMPDLNDAPDLKVDRAIEIFNEYMDGLL